MDKYAIKQMLNYIKYIIVKFTELLFYIKYTITPKKNIEYAKSFKKIALICVKPMGLGDLIMDTPFIKTLRKHFPNAEIHLITDKDIFDNVHELDKIIVVNGGIFSLMKEFYKLRKENYDLGIIMNRCINQTIYLELLNPKYKLGYLAGWKILANFRLKKDNLRFTKNEHFWNMSLKIAKSLGINDLEEKLIDIDYSEDVKRNAKKAFDDLKLDSDKKTVIINPFVLWKSRKWDDDNYIELIEKIHGDFNIVLYGGPDSLKSVEYIQKKLNEKGIYIKSVAGKLKLKEAFYFLKFADLFITSDSGPMHFAFLMGAPTLALFGPVNPLYRLPKNFKKYKIYDYLWYHDFKPLKKFYNYEYEYINKEINGLKAIPVEEVKNKIYGFFEKGEFY
ncbi:glycosyltransferase family 9 protein [Methanothermococcus okinawensis]|uniref:Glycosyl transferase family 9 n=1 Tax=Methanothermococcus okinawensis (strain DSM 14208 / JCM 11175 / IH1) TaxID=647113 RepID=F8AMK9_METOI|nr:glycosyltransferase family 9 protein [Methanothermococcus okinawensis]AEH06050.1 glycosyl transferase family 9 [Methanothermococcus okinawensis IH1]